jgi:enoyl-CoA hydratase/carnithine racemase
VSFSFAIRRDARQELVGTFIAVAGIANIALAMPRHASLAPAAVQMMKLSLNAGADVSLSTALELEGKMYATLKTTEDYAEGLAAWREKRPPNFRGR